MPDAVMMKTLASFHNTPELSAHNAKNLLDIGYFIPLFPA